MLSYFAIMLLIKNNTCFKVALCLSMDMFEYENTKTIRQKTILSLSSLMLTTGAVALRSAITFSDARHQGRVGKNIRLSGYFLQGDFGTAASQIFTALVRIILFGCDLTDSTCPYFQAVHLSKQYICNSI